MLEKDFVSRFFDKLKLMFPDIIYLKNDATYIQGIPDWIVLRNDTWVMLEFKRSKNARKQPNQTYYVELLNNMSYAAFVYPENEEEVLNEIQSIFSS